MNSARDGLSRCGRCSIRVFLGHGTSSSSFAYHVCMCARSTGRHAGRRSQGSSPSEAAVLGHGSRVLIRLEVRLVNMGPAEVVGARTISNRA